jgi:hypothetical protein
MIVTGDFGELRAEADVIEVTSNGMRPDPKWRFTDAHGHEHYRADDGTCPTLVNVVDDTYWCFDCDDEHTDSHLGCAICGEEIKPGLLPPSPFREFIQGRTAYYLNDVPISPERYEELLAARREQ